MAQAMRKPLKVRTKNRYFPDRLPVETITPPPRWW
jgi:hypothetical protein